MTQTHDTHESRNRKDPSGLFGSIPHPTPPGSDPATLRASVALLEAVGAGPEPDPCLSPPAGLCGAPREPESGDCPTSLDTTQSSCTHPADPAWVKDFRYRVAGELDQEWPVRAQRMRDCGEKPMALACGGCHGVHIFPERCNSRTCPTCARRGAAAVAGRISERITVHDVIMAAEPWDGPGRRQKRSWKMVTLTSPSDLNDAVRWKPEALRARVLAVGEALPHWWRRTPWGRQVRDTGDRGKRSRRDTSAVAALEIAPGGMVHVHVLVYGEYAPQADLQDAWLKALGVPLAIVDVRAVGEDVTGGIREALKYATKATGADRAECAAAVELAFRHTKRVRIYGALKAIQCRSLEADSEEATADDVHDHHVAACQACGLIGDWRYVTMIVDRETVSTNGGFGLLVRRAG